MCSSDLEIEFNKVQCPHHLVFAIFSFAYIAIWTKMHLLFHFLSACLDCIKNSRCVCLRFLCGSSALFTRPASTDFSKFLLKITSHDTIHIFKNYFVTLFLVFSF